MKEQLKAVSVLAELDRLELKYEQLNESELKILCPFHDDKTPSCNINIEKQLFKCHTSGCEASGDILTLFAKYLKTTRRVIWEDLSNRYGLDEIKAVDPSTVEKWYNRINEAKVFLPELYKRGITDAMIRKYRIGYDGSRIMIPIKDSFGQYVNIRKYLPGNPGSKKMINMRGHGQTRLYPIEQLKYGKIIICGGELKAIATAERINEFGIGAITTTSGEGSWEYEFNEKFNGKEVYVCFDIDAEGKKATESICARIKKHVKFVGKIELPLSIAKYPKGDANDFFGS